MHLLLLVLLTLAACQVHSKFNGMIQVFYDVGNCPKQSTEKPLKIVQSAENNRYIMSYISPYLHDNQCGEVWRSIVINFL